MNNRELLLPGTVDANKYTASLDAIRNLLKDKDPTERFSALSAVSVVTTVPIIALFLIVIDMFGAEDRLYFDLSKLMIFYDVGVAVYKDETVVQFK